MSVSFAQLVPTLQLILGRDSGPLVSAGIEAVDGPRRNPRDASIEIRVRLPIVYSSVTIGDREFAALSASDIYDLVAVRVHGAASVMRAHALRDIMLGGRGVDYESPVLDGAEPREGAWVQELAPSRSAVETGRHEFYERLGSRMIEEGERLMRRAKESR